MKKTNYIFLILLIVVFGCNNESQEPSEQLVSDGELSLSSIEYLNNSLDCSNNNLVMSLKKKSINDSLNLYRIELIDLALDYVDKFESNIKKNSVGLSELESSDKLIEVLFDNKPGYRIDKKFSAYQLKIKLTQLNNSLGAPYSSYVMINDVECEGAVTPWEMEKFYTLSKSYALLNTKLVKRDLLLLKNVIVSNSN